MCRNKADLARTLSNPVPPLFRWGGTCFRWAKLPEEVLSQYEVQPYELNNYISYAGFTSASRTSDAAWRNRVQFSVMTDSVFTYPTI